MTMPDHPRYYPSADRRAFEHRCPQCGAEPGQPCTYVWATATPPPQGYEGEWISKTLEDQVARFGQPTKQPHNARRHEEYLSRVRAYRAQSRAQLRAWLTAYGDIFREER